MLEADIHDRVNYAVEASQLRIEPEKKLCIFTIEIATEICPVMEYFEIFLERMVLCRKAAQTLGLQFELIINGDTAAVKKNAPGHLAGGIFLKFLAILAKNSILKL